MVTVPVRTVAGGHARTCIRRETYERSGVVQINDDLGVRYTGVSCWGASDGFVPALHTVVGARWLLLPKERMEPEKQLGRDGQVESGVQIR